jgi:hypothetical protein
VRYLPDSTSRTDGQLRQVWRGMMFYRVVLAAVFLSIFPSLGHSCELALPCLAFIHISSTPTC